MQRNERIKMEGKVFGKLTVLSRTKKTQTPNGSWTQHVLVQCSCGSEPFEIRWPSLKTAESCSTCRESNAFIDISGERYGHLTVVSATKKVSKTGSRLWECTCSCGKAVEKSSAYLRHNDSPSCGHAAKENLGTHKMSGTPAHRSWLHLLARARDDGTAYPGYADVTVCDRWNPAKGGSFENFLEDMGHPPEGHTINRINSSGVYSKTTCEWADLSLQSFDQKVKKTNKSGYTGVKWRKERGVWEARITKNSVIHILYYGPSFEDAVSARKEAEMKYYGFIKEGKYDKNE